MLDTIKTPEQWRDTVIIQLYKGKGPMNEFDNMRNIHTKLDIPKLFKNLLYKRAKPLIQEGTSKLQIGAIPNHRAQEYLFTLKSNIAFYKYLGISIRIQL